jgi:hypothetical protein
MYTWQASRLLPDKVFNELRGDFAGIMYMCIYNPTHAHIEEQLLSPKSKTTSIEYTPGISANFKVTAT